MWYFAWFLGVFLACSFGIINGLWFEQTETNEKERKQAEAEEKKKQ